MFTFKETQYVLLPKNKPAEGVYLRMLVVKEFARLSLYPNLTKNALLVSLLCQTSGTHIMMQLSCTCKVFVCRN